MDATSRPAGFAALLPALALAAAMTLAWTVAGWPRLAVLSLPDTDDLMRLQQIRDWLAGQPFADLTQHRMGSGGVAMHWSRLPDLVPAAIIALLAPVAGTAHAELVAVIAWPALLFAAFLALSGSLAVSLGAGRGDATIVAALAYPATTLFAPGRIDHHGLQIVLLLALVRGLLAGGARGGAVAGAAAIAGLATGIETVPLVAVALAAFAIGWTRAAPARDRCLQALALALIAGLVAAAAALASDGWRYPACDGFTLSAWRAGMVGATAIGALAVIGTRVHSRGGRWMALAAAGAISAAAVALLAPACLSPYGAIDPRLGTGWMAQVGEAQPLLAADPRWAISYAGLPLVALAAGLLALRRGIAPGLILIVALVATSLGLALVQVRGAYAGAALAPPVLALLLQEARARGALATVGAWLASAGIVWPLAASMIGAAPAPVAADSCIDRSAMARLAALPAARILAPVDLGPRLIAGTHHHAIAGPYHREPVGILAAQALASGGDAVAIGRTVDADLVVTCAATGWRITRVTP